MPTSPIDYDATVSSAASTRETLLGTALRPPQEPGPGALGARPRGAPLGPALRRLQEQGPGALRVRDLAAAAGQSTMGVYRHFGSKQGLPEQLHVHGVARTDLKG